jgi:Trypsin
MTGEACGARKLRTALIAAAVLALAPAPSASAGGLSVVERDGGTTRERAIAGYWSAERMRKAAPLRAIRTPSGGFRLRTGDVRPRNHPARFESGPVADPTAYPNSVHGKLFGRLRGIGLYSCSGTVVDAANRNAVVTAGHCVTDPTYGPTSKLVFVPAYDHGARPFGTWVFDRIVTQRAWRRNGNFNFDMAGVEMSSPSGAALQDAVGSIPVTPFLPVEQTYVATGYPVNRDAGEAMWRCTSPFDGYDPRPIPHGPTPFAIGCNMGVGASGGSLMVDGAVSSVVSFGYEDHRNVLYGPRLGRKLVAVYEAAANG